jgi:Na+-translocating ferredoxin:NAD+ oxidoreductase RnfC subunit
VQACIDAAGGALDARYAVIKGGPMMGRQFAMSEAAALTVGKADGGIVVLPEDHPLIAAAQRPMAHILNQARSVCIQCSYCTEMCPRYLLGHKIRPNRVMRSMATSTCEGDLTDALLCSECGVCELFACPMQLSPRRVNIYVKGLLREKGIQKGDGALHPEQSGMRDWRRVPQSRIIARLGLTSYPVHLDELTVCRPNKVRIALRHGVGRPSAPLVKPGDRVKAGDVVAGVGFEDVGCMIHASIDGLVTDIDGGITIEGETAPEGATL